MAGLQSLVSNNYSFGHCPNTFEPLDDQFPHSSVFSNNLFGNGDISLCLCQRWQCILALLHDVPTQSTCESYEGETRLLWHLLFHMLQKQLWYPPLAVAQATKLSEKAHDLQYLHLLCTNASSIDEKLNFLSKHLPYVRFPACDGCLVHSIPMEALREKYTMLVMYVWNTVNVSDKWDTNKNAECSNECERYGDQDPLNENVNHEIESKVYHLCHLVLFHPMFENHIKERARYILSQQPSTVDTNKSVHVTSPLVIPFTSDQGKNDLTTTPVSDGGIVHLLDEDTAAWRHSWKQVDEEDLNGDFKDKPSLLESSEQYSNVTTSELESSLDIMDSSTFSVNRTSSSSCFLGEHSRDLLHDEEEDSSRRRNFTHFSKIMQRDSDKEGEDKAEVGERINLVGRRIRAATETSPETRLTARSLPVARMYSMSVSWTAEELRHFRNDGVKKRERLPHYCSTSTDHHHHEPQMTEEGGSCGCSIFSSNSLVDINDSSVFDKEDEFRANDNSKQHPGMRNLQTWLKGLRLHKYTHLFQSMTYERFIAVSDAWLVDNGVTVGARRKILTHLDELRKMRKEVRDLRDRLERSIGSTHFQWRNPLVSSQSGGTVINHVTTVNSSSSSSHPRYNRSSSTSCCNPWLNNSDKVVSTLWPEDQQCFGLATEINSLGGGCLSGTGSPASTASSLSLGTSSNGYFTTSSSSTINPSINTCCTNVPPPSEMKRWCNELRFLLISPNSLDHSLNEDLFAVLQLLTNFHLRASDQLTGDQLRSYLETLKWAQRCEGFNKNQLSQCVTWHSRVESCIRTSTGGHGGNTSSPAVGSGCPPTPTNKSGQINRNKKTPGIQRALSLSCSSTGYMALSSTNNTSKSQGPNSSGLSRSASWKAKNSHGAMNIFRGGSTCGSVNRPQVLPPFTCHVQLGGGGLSSHLFHSPLMSPSSSASGISSSPLCTTSSGTAVAAAPGGTCKYSIQPQLWPPELSSYSHQQQRNSIAGVSPYSSNTGYSPVSQTSSTRQPIPLMCASGGGGGSISLATSLITSPFLNSPVSSGQNSSHSNFPILSRRSSFGVKNYGDSRLSIADTYLPPGSVSQLPDPTAILSSFSSVERTTSAPLQVSHSRGDGNHVTNLTQHQHVDTSPFSLNETMMLANEACFNNEIPPSRGQAWSLGDVDCMGAGLWEYRSSSSASGVSNNPFAPLNRTEPIESRGTVLFSLDESILDTDDKTFDFFSGGANFCDNYIIDPHNDLDSDLARLALDVSAKGMDETC